ncbi:MAG: hypothetical protein PHP50_00745 [Lachnospiraceae bacterium]|nr:hypothetical protein [Lachnospiraceae bacterium]
MRRNLGGRKVKQAMAIGLAVATMTSSIPMTAFAELTEKLTNCLNEKIQYLKGKTDGAYQEALEAEEYLKKLKLSIGVKAEELAAAKAALDAAWERYNNLAAQLVTAEGALDEIDGKVTEITEIRDSFIPVVAPTPAQPSTGGNDDNYNAELDGPAMTTGTASVLGATRTIADEPVALGAVLGANRGDVLGAVKTGDDTNMVPYVVAMAGSAAAGVYVTLKFRKKKEQN